MHLQQVCQGVLYGCLHNKLYRQLPSKGVLALIEEGDKMADLFDREQRILDDSVLHINEMQNGAPYDVEKFEILVKEYARLLKQLRRFTKISDKTTIELNTSKLDLLYKVQYDALTGIHNRRFLDDNLTRIIKNMIQSGGGMLSVLMMDLDFFKKYNDTYGHSMGDDCLKIIAKTLNDSVTKADDFVARFGGEEFVAVLPNTDELGACTIAKEILENVTSCDILHERNEVANCVTISIGVTTGDVEQIQNSKEYIKRADEALYLSKQNGRNRYTFINFIEKV